MKIKAELFSEGQQASVRRICRVLGFPRSSVYARPKARCKRYKLDEILVERIRKIIDKYPHNGLRLIHWRLNNEGAKPVNRKAVHRVLKLKGWTMKKRPSGMRPRAKGWKSATHMPNHRWAIDTSHFSTEKDGWCHITAVIDCCDRQIVGWRVSKSGKADVAAAALEDAIVRRRPKPGLRLRSDNGLVFASGKFCKTAQLAGCLQEYITPYTPEQNGMIERWFKTLKTECIWHKNFSTISSARAAIDSFVEEYNERRPHRSLGMLTPSEWAERFVA